MTTRRQRLLFFGPGAGSRGDSLAPTVVITSDATEPVTAAFTATFTFSEDVTGFVVGDITVANATLSAFTAVSGSVYTATVTPDWAGDVSLSVAAGVCEDLAGNPNAASEVLVILSPWNQDIPRATKTPSETSWEELRTTSYVPLDMLTSGLIVGFDASQRLYKTADGGENWVNILYALPSNQYFPTTIRSARVAGDGNLIVWLYDGTVYRSNATTFDSGFTKVFTIENVPDKVPRNSYGSFVYDQYVFFNEYGDEPSNHAYLSSDYGVTFSKVFTLPDDAVPADQHHVHNVAFDPYEQMLWVCAGDSGNRMIYYRPLESTGNWTLLGSFGDFASVGNMIQIIPLPECILFITDAATVGAYKLPRVKAQRGGYTFADFALAYQAYPTPIAGSLPIGSRPVIKPGNDACCYFSYEYYHVSEAGLGDIFSTRDGTTFYNIAQSTADPAGTAPFGITLLLGPASNGYIYGYFCKGDAGYLIRFAEPTWS